MMEQAAIIKAASIVIAIGTIGGGALTLDHLHAPRETVERMQSQDRVRTIMDLVETAHHEGKADWICRAIEEEFAQLCTETNGQHYFCTDKEAKKALKAKAGCG